jgi:uncharacterized ferritin-like protein (DUF455 family)
MFTREDYKEYFSTIESKEKYMVTNLEKIKGIIGDRAVIEVIDLVLKDEIMHVKLANKLFEYLR